MDLSVKVRLPGSSYTLATTACRTKKNPRNIHVTANDKTQQQTEHNEEEYIGKTRNT
jgi:hypothetical protein